MGINHTKLIRHNNQPANEPSSVVDGNVKIKN